MIKKWITSQPNVQQRFMLIFKGTRDGFDANTFHKKCDGKTNTIVLVQIEGGKVFGGFTEAECDSLPGYKQQDNCFIFSVDTKSKEKGSSISTNKSYGPTFGRKKNLFEPDISNMDLHIVIPL